MSEEQSTLDSRAAGLRQAFDHGFAEAPKGESTPTEAFLAISAGSDGYALRLAEICGLYADRKVTPLPTGASDLLGLAGFRGVLVPVYDLRILLGYPTGPSPRWLALVAPQEPIALAFDRFEGHLHARRDAIAHDDGTRLGRQHIDMALRTGGAVRPIVSVASILKLIKQRAQSSVMQKER